MSQINGHQKEGELLHVESPKERESGDGNDGERANGEGQADALEALYRELTQSFPLPQQGGEEAAEQEEHRHTEPVDREEHERVDAGDLGGVSFC